MTHILVFYYNTPMMVIEYDNINNKEDVLNWYAKHTGYDRVKLAAKFIAVMKYKEEK